MDRGARRAGARAARHGQLHGQVPGAPRGDPAAARCLAGGAGRGAAGRGAIRAGDARGRGRRGAYRQGEIHRLRGERAAAERAYRMPGNAAGSRSRGLPVAAGRGQRDAAAAAIRRAVGEPPAPSQRACCSFPPYIEIMLAVGRRRRRAPGLPRARGDHRRGSGAGCSRRDSRARSGGDRPCRRGRLGRPRPAASRVPCVAGARCLRSRRRASRVLVGLACRALGDEDTATLELETARACSRSSGPSRTSPASTRSPPAPGAQLPRAVAARAGGVAHGRRWRDEQGDRRVAGHQ